MLIPKRPLQHNVFNVRRDAHLIWRHAGVLHHHALNLIGHPALGANQRLILSLLDSHHALVAGWLTGHDRLVT